MIKFFERTDAKSVWVTTSEGELVGVLPRATVEYAAAPTRPKL
jgi:hypothetical protein